MTYDVNRGYLLFLGLHVAKNKENNLRFILWHLVQSLHANRWGNNGNNEKLYLGGSKISADNDCSHDIKRPLLLGRKAIINLDTLLKSRNITLPTKVLLVKAMVFPVVIYGCENWNIKKAEYRRIDAFELWYWRRLFRVPWTARRSNQSILCLCFLIRSLGWS